MANKYRHDLGRQFVAMPYRAGFQREWTPTVALALSRVLCRTGRGTAPFSAANVLRQLRSVKHLIIIKISIYRNAPIRRATAGQMSSKEQYKIIAI
jgi:hypothetical protein